jgi:hypothetical protein
MRVALFCRGCGTKSVDDNAVRLPNGRVRFCLEHRHGERCPHVRKAKEEGIVDGDWLEMQIVDTGAMH